MTLSYCWKVARRIACDECNYPQSEALFGNIKEWLEVNPNAPERPYLEKQSCASVKK